MVVLEEAFEIGRRCADDFGQVLAGAEAAPGAGQQERAASLVGGRLVERGIQCCRHLDIQRVQSLRPVQRDPAIPGTALDEKGHCIGSLWPTAYNHSNRVPAKAGTHRAAACCTSSISWPANRMGLCMSAAPPKIGRASCRER